MKTIPRPKPGDYAPHASIYLEHVADVDDILESLLDNMATTQSLIASLSPEQLAFRYAPDKWSIKQIVSHLSDDERIYVYRALRFARGDQTELPGFDQDRFAASSAADNRSIDELLDEFATVRLATVAFFEGLSDEALGRRGIADGSSMTVAAIAYHLAGHELQHLKIIRERYL